jgi:hypothetical protein
VSEYSKDQAADLLIYCFRRAVQEAGGQWDPDNSAEVRAAVDLIVDPLKRQIDDLRAQLATGAIAEAIGVALAPVVAEIGNDVESIHRRLGSLESYANGMGY